MDHPLAAKIVSATLENDGTGDGDGAAEKLAAAEKARDEATAALETLREEKGNDSDSELKRLRQERDERDARIKELTDVSIPKVSPEAAGDHLEEIADGRVVLSE